jgi:hypothetical protein
VALALTAHSVSGSTDNLQYTTPALDTSGANLLVVVVGLNADVAATMADSKSNSWSIAVQQTGGFAASREIIFYSTPTVVGTGHTFTITVVSSAPAIEILAFSGAAASSPLDQINSASGNFVSTIQPGSVTPTADAQVVVAGATMGDFSPNSTLSINGGFTISDQISAAGGAHTGGGAAYLIQTTAAAANPTWTSTHADLVSNCIATFKVAAAAAITLPLLPPPIRFQYVR